jgi:nickel transport protein
MPFPMVCEHHSRVGFLYPCATAVFLVYLVIGTVFSAYPVFAHKVSVFAYVENGRVYTESYFPDGKPAVDGKIDVYNSDGILLVEGRTDSDGLFDFKVKTPEDLKIVLNASMGHRAEYVLKSEELTGSSGAGQDKNLPKNEELQKPAVTSSSESGVQTSTGNLTGMEIQRLVGEELSNQLEPIRRSIMDLQKREKASVRDIFSGIGYILGLMGIALFVYSRQRDKVAKKDE